LGQTTTNLGVGEMIVKISEVYLYGALNEDVLEVYQIKKFLEEQGIDFKLLFYLDEGSQSLSALSTWSMGEKDALEVKPITKYPLVVWSEHHDDLEKTVNIATSLAELQAKVLITRKGELAPLKEANAPVV
jgi:hypothetical protein